MALLLHRLRHRLLLLHEVVAYATAKAAKEMRWHYFIRHQSALDKMCMEISGGDRNMVVGYGAANFDNARRGNRAAPTVAIKRRLKDFCRVYNVDEFRTSRNCAACNCPMRGMLMGEDPRSNLNLICPCLRPRLIIETLQI